MAESQERLDHLRVRLFDSPAGSLYQGSATRLVPGTGDPEANLMIVGEAPGSEEDRTGIPLVGPSGFLLNSLLARANIRREEVYVTNVVKRRPPNNRDPSWEEIAVSMPWLHAEIAIVRPQVILALGRFASCALTNRAGAAISTLRTEDLMYRYDRTKMIVPLVATYHPSFVLRQADARDYYLEEMAGDLARATSMMEVDPW